MSQVTAIWTTSMIPLAVQEQEADTAKAGRDKCLWYSPPMCPNGSCPASCVAVNRMSPLLQRVKEQEWLGRSSGQMVSRSRIYESGNSGSVLPRPIKMG